MSETTLPETGAPGLTSAEVAERVARGQVNRVRRSDAAEYADIARRNLLTLFNALVVPAALGLFILGDYNAGLAVSGMAITNTVLGLVQEVRAKRHLDQLALLAETTARVMRDGNVREIPAGDVVLGDLLLLAAGEPVVADGAVVEAHFLEVDEALLTGESDPVPRRAGELVLSGSFCVAGEGSYRADRVGTDAFAQRTSLEARRYRFTASPLQRNIDRLIRILTYTAIVFCAGYVVLYVFHPIPKKDLVGMIAATVTSMVPQGLVLMTTVAFTLGAVRMSRRGAVVQHLSAVESMAAVDTLCLDKTGTLTTNNLRLDRLCVVTNSRTEEEVRSRLRRFASASLDRGSKSVAALRVALGETSVEVLDLLPFKSQNRYSAVRVRAGDGDCILALGACEALRPYLAPEDGRWEQAWKEWQGTGLRLLLFAEGVGEGRPTFAGSLDGFVLRPLALVALSDELRPEAAGVLQTLARQGIAFKILSGDNPETVRATVEPLVAGSGAPALDALARDAVVTGAELEAAGDPGPLVREHCVFGRVSPGQKVEIVQALRAQGRHVAMIGDGVNDVLPIKSANLGIALGAGSRAARTVAGLVLETNDFGLLPETLEEGRTILRNLRRAGKLFLVKNAYTLVLIVGALGVFRLPFPFLPQQVTLLNFLTIGVPAFAIALSRERSPSPSRRDFLREVGGFAIRTGLVIGLAGLALMAIYTQAGPRQTPAEDVQVLRTLLLTALVLLGVTTLLRALTDGEGQIRRPEDRRFRLLAVAAVPVYLLVLYCPPAADFFRLTPLGWVQWAWVLAAAVPTYALLRASDRLFAPR